MDEFKVISAGELNHIARGVNARSADEIVRYLYKQVTDTAKAGGFVARCQLEPDNGILFISELQYTAIRKIQKLFPGIYYNNPGRTTTFTFEW